MRSFLLFLAFIAVSSATHAQQPGLSPLQFLLGTWEAEPSSSGTVGSTTFAPDLQGKVIVRTNHAEYPPAGGRPAIVHDDLMVIYAEPAKPLQADYYDNENHVIRYVISSGPLGGVIFLSPSVAGTARYRLTYTPVTADRVAGQFEIAPPDKPEAFSTFLRWFMRRTSAVPGARIPATKAH